MKDKKIRKLKVYGYSGHWCSEPPYIRLKGQWLKKIGFESGDSIEVQCRNNKIVIKRVNTV